MEAASLKIRRVSLDALHADPSNARTHGPENLESITASLQRFGQAEPLVVQQSTGRVNSVGPSAMSSRWTSMT
jgi:ParB-like chromosome segregation protein Spo0J